MEGGMDAEIPNAIALEKPEVREAWGWAEVVAADPFPRLKAWLEHKGIERIPSRTEKRNTIYKRVLKKGLWGAWQSTKGRIKDEWWGWPESSQLIAPKVFFSRRLKEELLWRLCELLIVNAEISQQESRARDCTALIGDSEEGMEFLPPWMRWVALHPHLRLAEEDEESDERKVSLSQEYAKKCPNQAAMNWFWSIRGDNKAILEFFKQVGAKWSDEVKRTNSKPEAPDDEELAENEAHLASLEEMLGRR